MKNPALVLDITPAIQTMMTPIYQSGLPLELLEYISVRVGQMNNCELCVEQSFIRSETNFILNDQLDQVLAWKGSSQFTEAEQVALEATEAITALNDKYNSVSDLLWSKIDEQYDEQQKAALITFISIMNMFTRMNVATRQLTADWN